jgi:hypothetical protein
VEQHLKKLGRNLGGYRGEVIDIASVLADCHRLAAANCWLAESIRVDGDIELPVFHRGSPTATRHIYISTGIHADEPAGPLAIRALLEGNDWPDDASIKLLPCLNPAGFPLNQRESPDGHDLNRDYRHFRSAEIRAHVAWLRGQPSFDLCLCLHEDWEAHGFYLYELNPDHRPSLAPEILRAVSTVCPIDPGSVIDGREARAGLIRPALDPAQRPEWPEAFYLIQHQTRLSYTLEAPSDFPMPVRVTALAAGSRAAVFASGGRREINC